MQDRNIQGYVPVENGTAIHVFSVAFRHCFGSRFRRENPIIPDEGEKLRKGHRKVEYLPITLQFR